MNPLDIPELLALILSFVPESSHALCALVTKKWKSILPTKRKWSARTFIASPPLFSYAICHGIVPKYLDWSRSVVIALRSDAYKTIDFLETIGIPLSFHHVDIDLLYPQNYKRFEFVLQKMANIESTELADFVIRFGGPRHLKAIHQKTQANFGKEIMAAMAFEKYDTLRYLIGSCTETVRICRSRWESLYNNNKIEILLMLKETKKVLFPPPQRKIEEYPSMISNFLYSISSVDVITPVLVPIVEAPTFSTKYNEAPRDP